PGEFMRGRHSYAMLTQLGVTETIASVETAYVELAVRLGVDDEWRKAVITRMRDRFPRLYGDTSCVRALEEFTSGPYRSGFGPSDECPTNRRAAPGASACFLGSVMRSLMGGTRLWRR